MSEFEGWVIDREYGPVMEGVSPRRGYGQNDPEPVLEDADRILGPQVSVKTGLKASEVKDPVRFRLLDDDGEVYYGGAISRSWLEGEEALAFHPLAFGETDAGCTSLEYRPHGKWVTL